MEGEFYIKFHLCNRSDKFKWILMVVYGPAQDEFKSAFHAELVQACQHNPLPTLIGGDFNILRNSNEKNNESFDLREIDLTRRQYTWANSLPKPTYEKLDSALMSTEWEFKYPLISVQALDRGVLDHTPLLLDTGTPAFVGSNKQFKFELYWLQWEGFHE
ncbi:hypothetical protein U9M48_035404, partial [Paspalum notatum var. saurae]